MIENIGHFGLLVIGFGLVIFIHELGHFLAAKAVGIRVDQFAIGFGRAVVAFRKGLGLRIGTTTVEYESRIKNGSPAQSMSETEYRLNWFPIGGYVKMLGQDDLDPTSTSTDPRSYTAKPIWARMVVISAGVIFNIISAFVLFVACFMHGVQYPPAVVGRVSSTFQAATAVPIDIVDSASEEPGIHVGDRVIQIDDNEVHRFSDILMAAAFAHPDSELEIKVLRDDRELTFLIQPQKSDGGPNSLGLLSLGLEPSRSVQLSPKLKDDQIAILTNSLSEFGEVKGDLGAGMQVVSVNDEPVENYWDIEAFLESFDGAEPVRLEFRMVDDGDDSAQVTMNASPQLMRDPERGVMHLLGLAPAIQIQQLTPPGGGAEKAGLLAGDIITRVDSVHWPLTEDLADIIADRVSDGANEIEITVWRDGEWLTYRVRPNKEGRIGIAMGPAFNQPFAIPVGSAASELDEKLSGQDGPASVSENGASQFLNPPPNLLPGSRIESVNGSPIETWGDLKRALTRTNQETDGPVSVRLGVVAPLPDAEVDEITWVISPEGGRKVASLGWNVPLDYLDMKRETLRATNPIQAIALGLDETWQMLAMTYLTIDRVLIRRSVDARSLKGPVGIAHLGTKVSQQGFIELIMFLAIISVNLAVLNFLPIPILDGGQFVFLIIEKLKGSPVSPAIQDLATLAGLIVIGGIFLFVTFNDVSNLIGGVL